MVRAAAGTGCERAIAIAVAVAASVVAVYWPAAGSQATHLES